MLLCGWALLSHKHASIRCDDPKHFRVARLETENHNPEHQIRSVATKAFVPVLPRHDLLYIRDFVRKAERKNAARLISKIRQEAWFPQGLAFDTAAGFGSNAKKGINDLALILDAKM